MRTDTDLQTERLVLRRSRPEDATAISAYRSLPEVQRHQGWERTDEAAVRADIEEMAKRRPGEPGWVQFSVIERRSGRLVGDVGLCPASDPGVIKIGYTVAPEAQGNGYASEAVRALIAFIFAALDATTVRAYADGDNLPSIRVAEHAGMRLMEVFEETDTDGTWRGVRYEIPRPGA